MIDKTNRIVLKFVIGIFLLMLFACSGSKKIVSTENDENSEKMEMEFTHFLIEGNKLKTLGYFQEAIVAYNKCLEIKTNSAAVNYELANIYVFKKNYIKALDYAKKASGINKENVWYQLLYANLLMQNREYKKSVDILEVVYENNPDDYDILMNLADIYGSNKNDYKKAIKLYNKAESLHGVSEIIFFKKEIIYKKLGKEDKLLEELKKLVDTYPNDTRYIGIYAETLMNYGKNKEALNAYDRLFKIDPDNGIAHLSYGEFLMKIGETQKALEEFNKGLTSKNIHIEPKIDLIISLSNFYNKEFDARVLHSLLDKINETHKDKIEGHTVKAELFIKEGRLKEAKSELIIVLEKEKDNYMLWEQLILLESNLDEYKNMYDQSMEAIELFPNYPNFHLYHGIACQRLKKYKEGIVILELGVDLIVGKNDLKAEFFSTLGELYYRNEDIEKSFIAFDDALKFKPNNKIVLNNYSYYLALEGIDLNKAREMAKMTVQLEPGNSTYLDTYAWVLYKLNEFDEAKEKIELAIKNNSNASAVVIEHYGDILYRLGDKNKAMEQWKLAQGRGVGSEFLEIKIEKGELVE